MCIRTSSDNSTHYQYRCVKNFLSTEDNSLTKRLYSFKSTKTHQDYWVWVEFHPYYFIAIKFHLKSHRYCKLRYHKLTDFNEARPVIFTCLKIMIELTAEFPSHSFGFIGSNTEDWLKRKDKLTGKQARVDINEPLENTKRYRRYKRFVTTFISEQNFVHKQLVEKSAYILLNKTVYENNPGLLDDINIYFSDNYDYIFERS